MEPSIQLCCAYLRQALFLQMFNCDRTEHEDVGTDVDSGHRIQRCVCRIFHGPPCCMANTGLTVVYPQGVVWYLFNYLLWTLAHIPKVRAMPMKLALTPETTLKWQWLLISVAAAVFAVPMCYCCRKNYRRFRSRDATRTPIDTGEVTVALYPKPIDPLRRSQGLAGIRNQGTTCYLNCLLQALAHIPEFREFLAHLKEEGDMKNILDKDVRIIATKLLALGEDKANLKKWTDRAQLTGRLTPMRSTRKGLEADLKELEHNKRQVFGRLTSVDKKKTKLEESDDKQHQVIGRILSADEKKKKLTDKLKELDDEQWQVTEKLSSVDEKKKRVDASLEDLGDTQCEGTDELSDVVDGKNPPVEDPKKLGDEQRQMTDKLPCVEATKEMNASPEESLDEQQQMTDKLPSVEGTKGMNASLEKSLDEQQQMTDKLPSVEGTKEMNASLEESLDKQRQMTGELLDADDASLKELGDIQHGVSSVGDENKTSPIDNQKESENEQLQAAAEQSSVRDEKTHPVNNLEASMDERTQLSTLKAELEQDSDQLTYELKALEPKRQNLTDQLNSTEKNFSNLMGRLTAIWREKQESKEAATKLSQDKVKLTKNLTESEEERSQLKERLAFVKGEEKGLRDTQEMVRKCNRELKDKENMLLNSKEAVTKLRMVPIEFHKLIELIFDPNQRSCSSKGLTDSLNWGPEKTHVQHDVQELYRSLLGTLEESLEGTSKEKAISELYHGSVINKITCQKCHKVNEREEDFVDLTLPITGMEHVGDSLKAMYRETEFMTGEDQYWCNQCQALVDAEKCTKVQKLPPILALSLLRFHYDFRSHRRSKDARRYEFEEELDMEPYCDQEQGEDSELTEAERRTNQDGVYELFAVIIHGGDAEGGHYHSYIKDVEASGYEQPEKFDQLDKKSSREAPENWFDFNDSRVSTIAKSRIRSQFEGYESAYMLFYRRKTMPPEVTELLQQQSRDVQAKEILDGRAINNPGGNVTARYGSMDQIQATYEE